MPFTNNEMDELVRVGPGTPSGEVWRRFWLPVECSANLGPYVRGGATPRNPIRVRVLGEDLVLFRDASGKAGLLAEHCSHRGTSLFFGRVEEHCLRCLYHGWAYDHEGNVVDTPGEPPESNFKHTVKHPSYPTYEVGGLIFAYLGPPELIPPFPRYEELFSDEGIRFPGNGGRYQNAPAFLQTLDNILDVWHREVLHGWFRATPPVHGIHHGRDGLPPTPIKYERTPWGSCYVTLQTTRKPGVYHYHETHNVWPGARLARPSSKSIKWVVPIDDYTARWLGVEFYPFVDGQVPEEAIRNQSNPNRISDIYANVPNDWVDQVGHWWNHGHPWHGQPWEDELATSTQVVPDRSLPDWDNWHLGTTDRGLLLQHELWREQVDRVREGMDPMGIIRGREAEQLIRVPAAQLELDWDEGIRLFNLNVEQRLEAIPAAKKAHPRRGRGQE